MAREQDLSDADAPTQAEIRANRERLGDLVRTTPTWQWRGPLVERRFGDTELHLKLELFQHAGSFKVRGLDAVIIPIGGGGLCAGVSCAIKQWNPDCVVFGVEPSGAATTAAMLGPLRDRLRGKRVGLIVCGANIDAESFATYLARGVERLAGV